MNSMAARFQLPGSPSDGRAMDGERDGDDGPDDEDATP